MTEAMPSVAALLDLAASTEEETIRRHALDRLAEGIRVAPKRAADGARGASAIVERYLNRLRFAGIPGPPRALDGCAVDFARSLVDLDGETIDGIANDLGVVEAIVLVRSLERSAASEVVRALDSSRDRLARLAHLAPDLSADGTREAVRQFTALSPRGFTGNALTRALGRSLLASMIVRAEPDVVASIVLQVPLTLAAARPADVGWYKAADAVVARHRGDSKERHRAH